MRRPFLQLSVLGLCLASASAAFADATLQGTIFKVHLPVLMLNVAAPKGERHFQCLTTPKTTVTINGKNAKLTDLAQGMVCQVTYGGSNSTASQIEAVLPKQSGG